MVPPPVSCCILNFCVLFQRVKQNFVQNCILLYLVILLGVQWNLAIPSPRIPATSVLQPLTHVPLCRNFTLKSSHLIIAATFVGPKGGESPLYCFLAALTVL